MATPRRHPGPALAVVALCAAFLSFQSAPTRAQGVGMGCSPTVADPGNGSGGESPVYRAPRDDSADRAERARRHAIFADDVVWRVQVARHDKEASRAASYFSDGN